MQCKNCGFLVPQNLKFAIMKNFCPQCGEKLLTDKEVNHISRIQSRVLKQEFSSELDEQEVYDISLFIYNEITSGYGRILIDDEIKQILTEAKSEADSETPSSDEKAPEEEGGKSIEKLKAQIREEEAARVALERRQEVAGEDVDDKVDRLKRIHKSNPIKQKNPVVRRLDS